MGSGTISSDAFLSQHWSGEDKKVHRVLIEFDTLLSPSTDPLLNLGEFNEGVLLEQTWTPQSSGISIKPKVSTELEKIWFNFLNEGTSNNRFSNLEPSTSYSEGSSITVPTTRYERNPHAREACLQHYGYACIICNFDFQKVYGEIGSNFIHVHHLNEVAQQGGEYSVDPVKDLRPVCPNCHAIIHRKRPAYSVEDVKSMISNRSFVTKGIP